MNSAATDAVWVGVDLGTQSTRTVIADDGGRVLALGSAPLDSRREKAAVRTHEQDPHQWWEAVGTASRHAFAQLPDDARRRPVGGVAICSTSGTVALIDDRGVPRTPALMYDDARASDELARLRSRTDVAGSADIQLSWALPKIGWLLRRHASTGRSPTYAAHSADVVAAALVGHRVSTDTSHALKSGYDLVGDRWNHALAGAAGIDATVLPDVVRPGSRLGTVAGAAAEHTGIPAGTPVVAGMTDGCAAQIAAGALAPGTWNSVLGTTLVLKGVSETLIEDPDGAVYSHRHPDGGWLPGGASNVGAGMIAEEFGDADLEDLARAARGYEPAGAVVYPLTARGERFPFVRPDAQRFEAGTLTGAAERYAAVLQGVAFVERLCFERLAALGADVSGELSVTGGGTRSEYWNQLRADVLGRRLTLPATAEPAFGMAVLASAREESVAARAARMVTRRGVVEPRPAHTERLAEGYERLVAELVDRGYISDTFTRPKAAVTSSIRGTDL
ncbi:FGGY-family carbohydrate kinase [Phytoactinopolyspora halotolerans]|uniref:Carbohydrate kinase n=1 Tax=Phytoactinopolyspora halotolerans TaxID=1981512 RepID=A0A6L9S5L8_9ACTN|nr:FGGY family carbohydrate kinase [Phytoactinopolyspora halotolerans]NEE00745.1 carbohydrate kinase [Phytoactinopolyspora halotolerans]